MRKLLLPLLALAAVFGIATSSHAANCSAYPYTLTNGQVADANQVMADFNLVRDCANNNLAHSGTNTDITAISPTTISGTNATFSGIVGFAAGSASAPSIYAIGDTNTGVYFSAADTINFTTGGTSRGTITSAGFTGTVIGNVTGDLTGNVTGNVTGDVTGAVTGNATTATAWATGRTVAITGDLAYTSGSLTGAANVTGTGTLATVNSNVGSFGSSTATPVITVNGKGLITAVSTASTNTVVSYTFATKTDNYTLALTDAGKAISLSTNSPKTITIPANASVAFPVGTVVRIYNGSGGNWTVAITTDGLEYYNGDGTGGLGGNRTLAWGGWCELVKRASTVWIITGNGIS